METKTVGDLLYWSYANLAMAHSAVDNGVDRYGPGQYMIRSRVYSRLRAGTMEIGPLADDDRVKMLMPQTCCYCGCAGPLSLDHLIPVSRGGENAADNLVWSCRRCNSSKSARDVLEWMAQKDQFPPLLLLRRYLKLAIEICRERGLMDLPVECAPELPFSLAAVPGLYPQPRRLKLWMTPSPTDPV